MASALVRERCEGFDDAGVGGDETRAQRSHHHIVGSRLRRQPEQVARRRSARRFSSSKRRVPERRRVPGVVEVGTDLHDVGGELRHPVTSRYGTAKSSSLDVGGGQTRTTPRERQPASRTSTARSMPTRTAFAEIGSAFAAVARRPSSISSSVTVSSCSKNIGGFGRLLLGDPGARPPPDRPVVAEQMDGVRAVDDLSCRLAAGDIELDSRHPPGPGQPLLEDDASGGAETPRRPPVPQVGLTQPCDTDGRYNDLGDVT